MLRVAAAQASRRAALRTAVVRNRQIRQISAGRRYALFARRRFDRLAAATTASLESAAAKRSKDGGGDEPPATTQALVLVEALRLDPYNATLYAGLERAMHAAGVSAAQLDGLRAGEEVVEDALVVVVHAGHVLDQEADEDRFSDLAQILLDQAVLAEGSSLDDPATYVARLNKLLVEMSDS